MRLAWSEVPWAGREVLSQQQADVVVCTTAPSGLGWQQPAAALARRLSMVLAAGGAPGGGMLVLSSMGTDVTGHRVIALATPAEARPRGACLVEVAPAGRAEPDRLTVIAADLSADELAAHREELLTRVPACGLSDQRVVVACVDRRLVDLRTGRSTEPEVTAVALRFEV